MLVNSNVVFQSITNTVCSLCGKPFTIYCDQMVQVLELISGRGVLLPICGECWHESKDAPVIKLGNASFVRFSHDPWAAGVCFYPTEGL